MDSNTQERRLADFKKNAMACYPKSVRVETEESLWVSLPGGLPCPTIDLMKEQQASGRPMLLMNCGPYYCDVPFEFGDQLPIAPLIGRAFRHGVHDCWSLCRDYYRKQEVVLKDYPRDWGWWKHDDIVFSGAKTDLKNVDDRSMEEGDIVLWSVSQNSKTAHTSVYMGENRILHHTSRRGRCYDPKSLSEIVPADSLGIVIHSRWRP